ENKRADQPTKRKGQMKAREKYEMIIRLQTLGFDYQTANALRRISMTLGRWFELECGTENASGSSVSIEREGEDGDGRPFMRIQYMGPCGQWVDRKRPIADRE